MSGGPIELNTLTPDNEDKSFEFPREYDNESGPDEDFEIPKIIDFQGHTVFLGSRDVKRSIRLRLQVAVIVISFMIIGVADQSLGSVMEYLLSDYQTDRTHISYLFLCQAIGYMIASFGNNMVCQMMGLKGLYPISLLIMALMPTAIYAKLNFPTLVSVSMINGLGFGTLDCAMNLFVGGLKYSNQLLGLMHAFYGLGCFISPLLCTYLIHRGFLWNQYYLFILGLIAINFVGSIFLFSRETRWKYRYQLQQDCEKDETDEKLSFRTIITNKFIIFFSLCLFTYLGSELSMGVWLFNYLLNIHSFTDKSSSYVTSAYWIAFTAGRFFLSFITGHLFEDYETKAMVIYCTLVTIGTVLFWLFNHVYSLMVCSICFVGFFVGPMFSTTVVIAMKTLPKKFSTAGVAVICGLGAMGSTVMPYIMGLIADSTAGGKGAGLVYFPLYEVLLFAAANMLWLAFFVKHKKKLDSYERLSCD
ncbi:hypothetical protein KL919_000853 [Ogataea angusta]|nr:hypothetical protein KL943_001715 [Ogataea angusta]KAG7851350.1 hypothetical protein KL941_001019 [Ogataea angusta]KAG7859591.1 hypothetical protein KL939_002491 [Ogataea angusta]KAG7863538.1 hypothetical protein KL919_000853 [Ogataea angusta]